MSDLIRIELHPLGRILEVRRGEPLMQVLFPHGVEFPCGGTGRCRGCRIRVLRGHLPATEEQAQLLGAAAIRDGWRLACRCQAEEPLTLELAQWEAPVLADNTSFSFQAREGFGIAVDLGTTTIAVQLLERSNGQVLGVETALNEQAQQGADIMTRVGLAVRDNGGPWLTRTVRQQVGAMIGLLLEETPAAREDLKQVVLVGNTVMHHLFCGIDVEPLSHYPFETDQDGHRQFSASELGWELPSQPVVSFLPCLGGFVGSDILGGILATRLHEKSELGLLIDLGTNGEIVLGNRERLLCASTAAGPAFEGARISMGMRAATGAISGVWVSDGALSCRVIGQTHPRGICGSGLVDAVAASLDLGWIQSTGRLAGGQKSICLMDPVVITQGDVRELQLAKGAIAAGIRLLMSRLGASDKDIRSIYLAGAFGNYINRQSAYRIGLVDFPPERVEPAGNTALLGAKIALFDPDHETSEFARIRPRVEHIGLSADAQFQEAYIDAMGFAGLV